MAASLVIIAICSFLGMIAAQSPHCENITCSDPETEVIPPIISGNSDDFFYIGAILPLNTERNRENRCSGINIEGYQLASAFRWALATSHARLNPDPGVGIGGIIYNTHSDYWTIPSEMLSIETCKVGAFHTIEINNNTNINTTTATTITRRVYPEKIRAYIGFPGYETGYAAGLIEHTLSSIKKVMVTIGVESHAMRTAFGQFHLSSSLEQQVEAILTVISTTTTYPTVYTKVIHSADVLFRSVYQVFVTEARKRNIILLLDEIMTENNAQSIAQSLRRSELQVQFAVLFLSDSDLRNLLDAFQETDGSRIAFILPDLSSEYPRLLTGAGAAASGTVLLQTSTQLSMYRDAVRDFKSDFAAQTAPPNTDEKQLKEHMTSNIAAMIMATDVLVASLEETRKEMCGAEICKEFFNSTLSLAVIKGNLGSTALGNARVDVFNSSVIDPTILRFDVLQMSSGGSSSDLVQVGYTDSRGSYSNYTARELFTFRSGNVQYRTPTTSAPLPVSSTDGPDVDEPYTRELLSDFNTKILVNKGKVLTGVLPVQRREDNEYGLRDSGWVIALMVLAGLGILAVIIVEVIIFILLFCPCDKETTRNQKQHYDTRSEERSTTTLQSEKVSTTVTTKEKFRPTLLPVLGNNMNRYDMHSLRTVWLGQLLLLGILLSYMTLFAFAVKPVPASCGITRFGIGFCYALCFSVLLIKLLILLQSRPSPGKQRVDELHYNYLGDFYQLVLLSFAMIVQVVIGIQWLIWLHPTAVLIRSNADENVWICNHFTWPVGWTWSESTIFRSCFENHIITLVFVDLLVLVAAILAFKAREIKTNFRESSAIGLTMVLVIPLWLAWQIAGGLVATSSLDYALEISDACMAFGMLVIVTIILIVMFFPKCRMLVNHGFEGVLVSDDEYQESLYTVDGTSRPGSVYSMRAPSLPPRIFSTATYGDESLADMSIGGSRIMLGDTGDINVHNPDYPRIINADTTDLDLVDKLDYHYDPHSNHLKHPLSTKSAYLSRSVPNVNMVHSRRSSTHSDAYYGRPDNRHGGTKLLRVSRDLTGRNYSGDIYSIPLHSSRGPAMVSDYGGTLERARSDIILERAPHRP